MATSPINVTNMRRGTKKLGVPIVQGDYVDTDSDNKIRGVCAITACYAAVTDKIPKDASKLHKAAFRFGQQCFGSLICGYFTGAFDGAIKESLLNTPEANAAIRLGIKLARAAGFKNV